MALAERAELIARLTLKDELSPKLAGITRKLEGASGKLRGYGDQVVTGLGQNAKAIGILGAAAGAFVTSQVVLGIKSLAELERVQQQTEAVIASTGGASGKTAQQVRDLAEAIEDLTTADDKQIQSAENVLLTYGITNDIFEETTLQVANMAIALAKGDVANANFEASAVKIGKALQDPVKGLESLREAGIVFTDDQKDLIKTLAESGDTLGAQAVILKELEKRYGEAGRAAATGFGGDMRKFQDAADDARQALASGFLPVLSRLAVFLKTKLAEPKTIAAIKGLGEGLATGLEALIEIATNLPWGAIATAMSAVGGAAKALLQAFTSMPPWVQTAVITGWGLNKLTGGALGSIVGDLGKGLIKGVLGMTAGVVNINAGIVKGGLPVGGGAPAGGIGGTLKTLGAAAIAAIAVGAAVAEWEKQRSGISGLTGGIGSSVNAQITGGQSTAALLASQAALTEGLQKLANTPFSFVLAGGAMDDLKASLAAIKAELARRQNAGPTSGGKSPDERSAIAAAPVWQQIRDAAKNTTTVLSSDIADTKGAITLLRTSPGVNGTALQSFRATERAGKMNAAISTFQLFSQRSGDNRIVAAIYATRPKTTVTVNVTAASVQKAQVTQSRSGTATGSRYGIS